LDDRRKAPALLALSDRDPPWTQVSSSVAST